MSYVREIEATIGLLLMNGHSLYEIIAELSSIVACSHMHGIDNLLMNYVKEIEAVIGLLLMNGRSFDEIIGELYYMLSK